MKRIVAAASLLIACFAARAEPGITDDRILIGQTAGFTGTVAGGVKEATDGAKLYLDWINRQGGVNGRRIELLSLDDAFDPKRAGENAKVLIDDKHVFALFLCRGTPHAEAILPLLKAGGVPLIAPSTGADLLHRPVNPYVFNVRAKYQLEAQKGVEQLASMGIQRIGVIHVDDSFGKDALVGAMKGFEESKMKPLAVVSYDRTTNKVDGAVEALAKGNPQAAILIGSGNTVADIVAGMRKASPGTQLVTLSNNASAAFVKSLGANARGVIVTQVFPNPKLAVTPIAVEMQRLARDKPGSVISHQAMEGFAGAKVLVEGLRKAGRRLTREGFIKALDGLHDYDLGGLKVGYDVNDHTGAEYVELSMIGRDGQFIQH